MVPYAYAAFGEADEPELLAIRALGFITSARSGMRRLLAHTAIPEQELSRRPIEAEHLASILDFVITDEALLTAFARAVGVSLETVYEARRLLRMPADFAGAAALSRLERPGEAVDALRR